MAIQVNLSLCDGCRGCELACSFYHRQVFAPESSSIKVVSDCRTGEISVSIDSTCDSCLHDEQAPCEEACVKGALCRRET